MGVRVGAAREQQSNGAVLPGERREVQRREPVPAPAIRQTGIGLEEHGEPVEVAERRRLEDIQGRDPGLDGLGEGAIEAVPGAEQGGHALVVASHREGWIGVQHGADAIRVSGVDRREQIVGCTCHRDTFSLSSLFA